MAKTRKSARTRPATRATKAKVRGGGAIAQGKRAAAAGKRAVVIQGDNKAPINTGDIYQPIIERGVRPGAGQADLRNAYLAWLSARANVLPLFAGDRGDPVQLSAVYTALLT